MSVSWSSSSCSRSSDNILYSKQFVGSTEANLREKNAEHRADIERQDTLLGRHFASVCGYDNWTIQIIDTCERRELARRSSDRSPLHPARDRAR